MKISLRASSPWTLWLWICLMILHIPVVHGHTFGVVKFKCPIDGVKFETEMDMSGTQFGMRLDLKPLGPIASPWRLAVCPRCHFVLFKDKLDRDERSKLKPFILSGEYQAIAKKNSPYYCLAKIFELLGETEESQAICLLKASWEVESDRQMYERYLRETRTVLDRYIAKSSNKSSKWWPTAQFLVGEISRLLGEFEAARNQFQQLQGKAGFEDESMQVMIEFELELIEKLDSSPHQVPSLRRPSQIPTVAMARTMPGYDEAMKRFHIEEIQKGNINSEPESLYFQLVVDSHQGVLDGAWWWSPLVKGEPTVTWDEFCLMFDRAERRIQQCEWLWEWKECGSGHWLELHVSGLEMPHDLIQPEPGGIAQYLWAEASLSGAPSYEIYLRRGTRWCGTVYLGNEDSRGIVTVMEPGEGCHWLDLENIWCLGVSGDTYLVVAPDGSLIRCECQGSAFPSHRDVEKKK
jgi:hypothetical protein